MRKVAAEVGIAPATAGKIRDEEKIEALCPCGQDAKHKGWCAYRFQNSPARQATVEKMNMSHVDPHEEAEQKIAQMIERGKHPHSEVENCEKCGASLTGQKRVNMNRCTPCWHKYLKECAERRKAERNSNGHKPDRAAIAENPAIIEEPKTGNGHGLTAAALDQMIAEKEAQITILQDDIVALRRVADILQT